MFVHHIRRIQEPHLLPSTNSFQPHPTLCHQFSPLTMPCNTVNPRNILCTAPGCDRLFSNHSGLNNHLNTHRRPQPDPDTESESNSPTAPTAQDNNEYHDLPPLVLDEDNEPYESSPKPTPQANTTHHPFINGMKSSPAVYFV